MEHRISASLVFAEYLTWTWLIAQSKGPGAWGKSGKPSWSVCSNWWIQLVFSEAHTNRSSRALWAIGVRRQVWLMLQTLRGGDKCQLMKKAYSTHKQPQTTEQEIHNAERTLLPCEGNVYTAISIFMFQANMLICVDTNPCLNLHIWYWYLILYGLFTGETWTQHVLLTLLQPRQDQSTKVTIEMGK